MSNSGTILSHAAIYVIGTALTAAGGFLLIPLFTHNMSTEAYGTLELINRTVSFVTLFSLLGIRQAYARLFFEFDTEDERRRVTGTTLVFALSSSTAAAAVFYGFLTLSGFDPESVGIPAVMLPLLLMWLPAEIGLLIGLSYLQVNRRPFLFVATTFSQLLIHVASSYTYIVYMDLGMVGALLGNLTAVGSLALIFVTLLGIRTRFGLSLPVLRRMLSFGLPYIPATLVGFVAFNGDRYALSWVDFSVLGTYAVASKFGSIGNMLVADPLTRVWGPLIFSEYRAEDGAQRIADTFVLFVLVVTFFNLCVCAGALLVLPFIVAEEYLGALDLIPAFALCSTLYSIFIYSDAGILIRERTHLKIVSLGVGAVTVVLLSYPFIRLFGGTGAVMTLAASILCMFIANWIMAQRCYHIPVNWSSILCGVLFCALGVVACYAYMDAVSGMHLAFGLGVAVPVMIVAILMWMSGLVPRPYRDVFEDWVRVRLGGAVAG